MVDLSCPGQTAGEGIGFKASDAQEGLHGFFCRTSASSTKHQNKAQETETASNKNTSTPIPHPLLRPVTTLEAV